MKKGVYIALFGLLSVCILYCLYLSHSCVFETFQSSTEPPLIPSWIIILFVFLFLLIIIGGAILDAYIKLQAIKGGVGILDKGLTMAFQKKSTTTSNLK